MSDLVERVARALLNADFEHGDGPTGNWDDADPTERLYFLAGAQAAIAEVRRFDVERGPSDAEIEAAITNFQDEVCGFVCFGGYGDRTGYDAARANLPRLIAQQREAAVREALESVRDFMSPWYHEATDDTEAEAYNRVAKEIAAMLAKEAE